MAVFTELDRASIEPLLQVFDLGSFVSLVPIAAGIENTNYYLETSSGRWVLTLFERLKDEELPFYLELCEHLAKRGCRVALPRRTQDGRLFTKVCGRSASVANRIEGDDIQEMGLAECRSMGRVLAQMHLAAKDFPVFQKNLRGFDWWVETTPKVLPYLSPKARELLQSELKHQTDVVGSEAYRSLTVTACHCDLFRNNALIAEAGTSRAEVAGVFDFYFAGCSPWLFDLAVTMNDWCVDLESGKFRYEQAQAFIEAYDAVRPLRLIERSLWRDALRAGALRFWLSRLYDFYLPRSASLLKPHDPTHFERILQDRRVCALPWPK